MKRIGVLTSGGDAPGMNACLRAIALTAHANELELIGFQRGFNGVMEQQYQTLSPYHVSGIIQNGGTILKSARCEAMHTEDGLKLAAANLHDLNLDGLLVIGGDGSFRGTVELAKHYKGQLVGIPGTIDNDVDGSDFSIGFATALDTALDAIDKIRDTADAFERIFLVEVMGRHTGYLAVAAGIAAGAEQIICPELASELDLDKIAEHVEQARKHRGNCSYIIVIAETMYPGGATVLAADLEQRGIECRASILGHIQRGGRPVGADRILATKLGAYAVEQLVQGAHLMMAGEINGKAGLYPLALTGDKKKQVDSYLLRWQQQVAQY
ncbi:MAG: ATP-dependent 6-phosphofructokinase [Gammaproteobacteria bacterium]|nr:ATP-dependent 6-phosphofructokinase [Gammaproteobacteria bacterium]MBU2057849.1 ATP-dependent 6-phosphofructokinase [Gammaproteobacteria bacterium]MBU2176716.1 ATP-dependent 6-phosphofructokinase [Gammaproteobacteria bacterium]MBU2247849.1 ATP-dependent 6-phosphofructokinase [Gammaproteobacteria bacterium]MBU2346022.1 ATP-dependent 6-phosphofructokinase [Gammaproteobacteria bacterium]